MNARPKTTTVLDESFEQMAKDRVRLGVIQRRLDKIHGEAARLNAEAAEIRARWAKDAKAVGASPEESE